MLLKMQKSIANVILFLGEGDGNFLRYVRLYIFVTLNLSRGGIKGDLASVTKYVGFLFWYLPLVISDGDLSAIFIYHQLKLATNSQKIPFFPKSKPVSFRYSQLKLSSPDIESRHQSVPDNLDGDLYLLDILSNHLYFPDLPINTCILQIFLVNTYNPEILSIEKSVSVILYMITYLSEIFKGDTYLSQI